VLRRYPPAGDWQGDLSLVESLRLFFDVCFAVVVEGDMIGILYFTSAAGGYPCVFNMSVPGSAKGDIQNLTALSHSDILHTSYDATGCERARNSHVSDEY
jgi:hypothetical protein